RAQSSLRRRFAEPDRSQPDATFGRSCRTLANQIARSHHHRRAIGREPRLFQFQGGRCFVTGASRNCLSPSEREEDEREGSERIRFRATLTLPLPLRQGEATQGTPGHSKLSAKR